ncbi:hypothetical protein L208DRAFT_1365815 [Tricholoma matsutake]|nr:hypothetical protein L208DRAFT_1365815 [Tricholoma matsutake 945]
MLLRHLARRAPRLTCRCLTTDAGTKPYYITTPIFYPNADPHIGHLYSLVVADIFARYMQIRQPGIQVELLTGTDDHGLKIQKAAHAKGLAPDVFCDQLSDRFRQLADKAQITHTRFMRTTRQEHHETVESVWRQLDAQGLIYKSNYSGWYSITDECFYTNDQVTSVSDTNSSISNSNPIVNSNDPPPSATKISRETGSPVEWYSEENYMLRLSPFQLSLLAHYTNKSQIFPPQHHRDIVHILSSGPLEDLSISRPRSRLEWGVPVPGDPEQTVYVWFDALLVYLSGIGYPWDADMGRKCGWPVNLQIVGKDILRFHAIYLPTILLALGLPLQKQLLAHAHWTVEQKKMSKSCGNVADPFEAIDMFGADAVRYYLARVGGRFRDDVDWSQRQLEKHTKEIQSMLGNLFLRTTSVAMQGRILGGPPRTFEEILRDEAERSPNRLLFHAVLDLPDKFQAYMDKLEISDALAAIVDILRLANKTLNETVPWKKSNTPADAYAAYAITLETLRVTGICLQPFIPGAAWKLLFALGVDSERRDWKSIRVDMGNCGVGKVVGVRLF